MTDQKTLDIYNAKADDYAAAMEAFGIHHTITRFAKQLSKAALVLDLGCGHGATAAYLQQQGLQVEAWDASTAMQQLAKQQFDIDVQHKTFDALQSQDAYHGICANYSLLHASPEQFPHYLAAIATALKDDGLLHLGMKIGEGVHRDKLGRRYAYYSEQQLIDYLEALGLNVEYHHHSHAVGLAGTADPGIAIHARKTRS